METAIVILSVLLVLFALLGLYDGFYLHIFKYQLFNYKESRFEHITHTIRAVLFPAMLYFLYLAEGTMGFYTGLTLVMADIIVLGIDAFVERDSRAFMGGLPRWEYIIHLFVNGFHFAAIAIYLVLRLDIRNGQIISEREIEMLQNFAVFKMVVINLIPGGILMAILHLLVAIPKTAVFWNGLRAKITCC